MHVTEQEIVNCLRAGWRVCTPVSGRRPGDPGDYELEFRDLFLDRFRAIEHPELYLSEIVDEMYMKGLLVAYEDHDRHPALFPRRRAVS